MEAGFSCLSATQQTATRPMGPVVICWTPLNMPILVTRSPASSSISILLTTHHVPTTIAGFVHCLHQKTDCRCLYRLERKPIIVLDPVKSTALPCWSQSV